MNYGQLIGRLIGHLLGIAGAVIAIWAAGRFFYLGNSAETAPQTAFLFVLGMSLQGGGKLICWFAGEPFLA